MKSLSVAIFAVALASGLCATASISDLAEAVQNFNYIALQNMESLKLEDVPGTLYGPSDAPYNVVLSRADAAVNGLSNLELTIVSTDSYKLTANFAVKIPRVEYSTNYQIDGSIFYIDMTGKGLASIALEGYSSQVSVTLKEVKANDLNTKNYIQIASIKTNSQYDDFLVNTTGLTVPGVAVDQIDAFVQMLATQIWGDQIVLTEKLQVKSALEKLNKLLVGLDIDDAVAWLNEQIDNGTASSALISFFG